MFGKLKNKLKSWTKSLGKKAEETEKEESIEETEEIEKTPKKVEKQKEKKQSKEEKKVQKRKKREEKKQKKPEKKEEPETTSKEIKKETEEIQEIPEEKPTEKKKKSLFKKIISSTKKITEEQFQEYSEELELSLIENNVALEVAEKIINDLKEKIIDKEIPKKEIEKTIEEALKEIIKEILIEPYDLIEKVKEFRKENSEPYVILFCGINGTGKTTSIAKIASKLKENKLSSVMAAGDTFRAASIEQIKKHGDNLGIKVIANDYGSDPASVGFEAIKYANKNNLDCVLIDTAGRMHTAKNLMQEIEKVSRITNPQTKIFVGESITGNDIVEQVKSFNQAIKIDGIILSKADIDEKGGTALSVGYVTKKPILYLGTGQEYQDLEKFDKNKFLEKLFSD